MTRPWLSRRKSSELPYLLFFPYFPSCYFWLSLRRWWILASLSSRLPPGYLAPSYPRHNMHLWMQSFTYPFGITHITFTIIIPSSPPCFRASNYTSMLPAYCVLLPFTAPHCCAVNLTCGSEVCTALLSTDPLSSAKASDALLSFFLLHFHSQVSSRRRRLCFLRIPLSPYDPQVGSPFNSIRFIAYHRSPTHWFSLLWIVALR